jgi:hypothetical protein
MSADLREAIAREMYDRTGPSRSTRTWEDLSSPNRVYWLTGADEILALIPAGYALTRGEDFPGLHRETASLVMRFAGSLAAKLRRAEEKYGYTDGWARDDWEAECRQHLHEHVAKGDPLDVAAYAAFCWAHGWSTASDPSPAPEGEGGWQPTTTLPDERMHVLTWSPKDRVRENYIGDAKSGFRGRWGKSTRDAQPTHWRPLPPPPGVGS